MLKTPAVLRLSGRVYFQILTVFTLMAFLVPLIVIDGGRTARAKASKSAEETPPPNNAPPQPYHVGSFGQTREQSQLVTAVRNWLDDVFTEPVLPAEFKAAKVSGFLERLNIKFSSTLAFAGVGTVDRSVHAPMPPPGPASVVDFDFDYDGKADIGRWRSSSTQFSIRNSNGGSTTNTTLGSSSAKPAPADFDGDGYTDLALFNAGTWTIKTSGNGQTSTISFGQSGDIPVAGNYTGSGTDDNLAVYRPSSGVWYWREFTNSTVYSISYGTSTDIPAPGDYDGQNGADFAVYRPSTGVWYVLYNGGGEAGYSWGLSTDIPVAADFDGDGKTDVAVFRPSSGQWYVICSGGSPAVQVVTWGNYADQPVPADYDGDGKADKAVWRPTTGVWFINTSGTGADEYYGLGNAGDFAVDSAYIKQVGGTVSTSALSKARLAPRNATGGTDLYSQNFSWGTSLVGLPGRSGLDAGLGISYNSLIWTKEGSTVYFDTNADNVSPGFRLGFPTIEPAYFDSTTNKWNYLMVTPSGFARSGQARSMRRRMAASLSSR